jgi:hypothetical protein
MKHVGKMKNNSARIAVVYRTIPGEHLNALVVGTNGLPDAYHDSLMGVIESASGQQANELADILATRRFPDGEVMLNWLHARGHLKKVPTNLVIMTPNTQTQIQLDELNKVIADQKGISVEDLAVTDGKQEEKVSNRNKESSRKAEEIIVDDVVVQAETTAPVAEAPVSASDLRSMADKLFKEAQALRKKADEIEPAAKKVTKTVKATA